MKKTKEHFSEIYKPQKTESEENIRRWKDLPWSWTGRINIVKMAILPNAIYVFNTIPIEIPMTFCTEIEKTIMRYIWKHKRPETANALLSKMPNAGGITISYFKTILQCHNNKNSMVSAQNRHNDQWIRIKDPDINPHINSQLIFNKGA
jgi:hypothetical protein